MQLLFLALIQIDSCCKLSGMPDLSLSFVNSRLLEDPSFHPCVRLKRWEVSFYCTSTVSYTSYTIKMH